MLINDLFAELSGESDLLWTAVRFLVDAFFGVLFLQSGLDKIFDWKGNLGWLTQHFSKTPFKNLVGPMVAFITLLECTSGMVMGLAALLTLAGGGLELSLLGLLLCCFTLLALFAGQRFAKDYAGAASLVPYFLLALFSISLLK